LHGERGKVNFTNQARGQEKGRRIRRREVFGKKGRTKRKTTAGLILGGGKKGIAAAGGSSWKRGRAAGSGDGERKKTAED